jgi:hypothetical protein
MTLHRYRISCEVITSSALDINHGVRIETHSSLVSADGLKIRALQSIRLLEVA